MLRESQARIARGALPEPPSPPRTPRPLEELLPEDAPPPAPSEPRPLPAPEALPRATRGLRMLFWCEPLRRERTRGRCLGDQVRALDDASLASPCADCEQGRGVARSLGVLLEPRDAGGGDDAE